MSPEITCTLMNIHMDNNEYSYGWAPYAYSLMSIYFLLFSSYHDCVATVQIFTTLWYIKISLSEFVYEFDPILSCFICFDHIK